MTTEATTETIATPDGAMTAALLAATGSCRGTAVLFTDGFGARPAIAVIAERIARRGYEVLTPNLFYREPPAPLDIAGVLGGGPAAEQFYARLATLGPEQVWSDVRAIAQHVRSTRGDRQPLVGVGICLGGRYALSLAGAADTCVLAASLHGAALGVGGELAPDVLAASGKAEIYIAVAQIDPTFSAEDCEAVEATLKKAGARFQIDRLEGAVHGFMMSDLPIYNEAAATQCWQALERYTA